MGRNIAEVVLILHASSQSKWQEHFGKSYIGQYLRKDILKDAFPYSFFRHELAAVTEEKSVALLLVYIHCTLIQASGNSQLY